MTLKMSPCHVDVVVIITIRFVEICILETGEKMPTKCLHDHVWSLTVTLTFDLLTSNSNQFIFEPNCTEAANLAKFPHYLRDIVLTNI